MQKEVPISFPILFPWSFIRVTHSLKNPILFAGDIRAAIQLQPQLKFNGGGHINHCILWTNLAKDGGGGPSGDLLKAIDRDFGSLQKMQEKMNAQAVAVQGSGWSWLGYNKDAKRLQLACCPNQDPLEPTTGFRKMHLLKFNFFECSLSESCGAQIIPSSAKNKNRLYNSR